MMILSALRDLFASLFYQDLRGGLTSSRNGRRNSGVARAKRQARKLRNQARR